jgi:hypothetical protein
LSLSIVDISRDELPAFIDFPQPASVVVFKGAIAVAVVVSKDIS